MLENDKIDIVVPWVDGNDPAWQIEYKHWKNKLTEASQGGGV